MNLFLKFVPLSLHLHVCIAWVSAPKQAVCATTSQKPCMKPCWNVRYQQLSKSKIERLPKQNAWIMKHFGMKPNPQKKTQDILPSFCPAPIPPLVGSRAVGFLIVAALATLLPFAEVVSLLRCVLGPTLSSRRCLETPKKHNNQSTGLK